MAKKILTSKELFEGKTTEVEEDIDEVFEEDEELPAVGVSTLLKEKKPEPIPEPKPVVKPKSELEKVKDSMVELRGSITGGANIHGIWTKLGKIIEEIEKML